MYYQLLFTNIRFHLQFKHYYFVCKKTNRGEIGGAEEGEEGVRKVTSIQTKLWVERKQDLHKRL